MNETLTILKSTSFTILSATVILVISQFLNNFLFDALKEFQTIKGKISYALIYTGNLYGIANAKSKKNDITQTVNDGAIELRKLACSLIEIHQTIPFKPLLTFLHIIPSVEKIKKVSGNIIGLSILLFDDDPWEDKNEKYFEIKDLLKIL
ncbi:hypothetical protein ND816_17970 [Leptospira levettii]|uniref:hypothetical protein n=1 Tax=Leptospira levettii TaxID=2023178 RepID=UPI00223D1567|nr:hypothetical protein [Leptospira levettii]MCW7509738.1 hypothetical protein [Leptospira levettii]MCW7520825.1 hypothetical protein [Leptospira levettii]